MDNWVKPVNVRGRPWRSAYRTHLSAGLLPRWEQKSPLRRHRTHTPCIGYVVRAASSFIVVVDNQKPTSFSGCLTSKKSRWLGTYFLRSSTQSHSVNVKKLA